MYNLSRKGYIIPKNQLNNEEKKELINNLTMKPFVLSDYKQEKSFPIYFESKNNYYIPKYYGIKHFGEDIKKKNDNW